MIFIAIIVYILAVKSYVLFGNTYADACGGLIIDILLLQYTLLCCCDGRPRFHAVALQNCLTLANNAAQNVQRDEMQLSPLHLLHR
jgi:hypothetical protein